MKFISTLLLGESLGRNHTGSVLVLFCIFAAFGGRAADAKEKETESERHALEGAEKQRAYRIWNLGRTDEAIRLLAGLPEAFPDVREAKSSFIHIGMWFENSIVVEAESIEAAERILKEAREFYRRALEDVKDQQETIADRAEEGLARIDKKLGAIGQIRDGKIDVGRGAELLGDMEASRAAARLMRETFDPKAKDAAMHKHLELVHQMDYLDAMYLKLAGILITTDEENPREGKIGFERYAGLMDEAALELIEAAAGARELFPESDRALDTYIYHADALAYLGGLAETREAAAKAGVIEGEGEEEEAGEDAREGSAREQYEEALEIYEAMVAEIDRRLGETEERPRQNKETLGQYRGFAEDGAANQRALIGRLGANK